MDDGDGHRRSGRAPRVLRAHGRHAGGQRDGRRREGAVGRALQTADQSVPGRADGQRRRASASSRSRAPCRSRAACRSSSTGRSSARSASRAARASRTACAPARGGRPTGVAVRFSRRRRSIRHDRTQEGGRAGRNRSVHPSSRRLDRRLADLGPHLGPPASRSARQPRPGRHQPRRVPQSTDPRTASNATRRRRPTPMRVAEGARPPLVGGMAFHAPPLGVIYSRNLTP